MAVRYEGLYEGGNVGKGMYRFYEYFFAEYKEDVVNSVKQQLQVFASALGRKPSINTGT